MSRDKQLGQRNGKGQFQLGHSGLGGRPKGSRNKLGEQFVSDLHDAWIKHGSAAIETVVRDKPHEFLKCIARLLPQQFDETLNINVSVLAEIKDFTEAYRYALSVIGSNKSPRLINNHGRSD